MKSIGSRLRDGAAIGIAASGLLVVVLLAVVVPRNEYRARLWFLLESPGDLSLHFALWFVSFAVAGLATLVVHRAQRWEFLGAAGGAALTTVSLSIGAYRWVPEFDSVGSRALVVLVTLLAAGALVWSYRCTADA